MLAFAAMLVQGLNAGWIGPFLPSIARTLDTSIDRSGLIMSALATGYLAALIAGGEVVSRGTPRQMLAGAMGLVAAGLTGVAFAPRLLWLLIAATAIGVGQGAIDIATNALVADLNRDSLGSALNYLHMMFGVGALLGPVIAGFAIAASISYSATYALFAIAMAALAVALVLMPGHHASEAVGEPIGGIALLGQPLIWMLAAILFFYVGAETGIGAWLYSYLRGTSTLAAAVAAWAVSLYWSGLVAGRFLGGYFAHRTSPRAMSIAGAALSAAALVVLTVMPNRIIADALMIALIGIGYGPIFPNMIAIGAKAFPAEVGRMTSVVAAGGAIGAMLLPWTMGLVLSAQSAVASMEFALLLTVLMIALIAILNAFIHSRLRVTQACLSRG